MKKNTDEPQLIHVVVPCAFYLGVLAIGLWSMTAEDPKKWMIGLLAGVAVSFAVVELTRTLFAWRRYTRSLREFVAMRNEFEENLDKLQSQLEVAADLSSRRETEGRHLSMVKSTPKIGGNSTLDDQDEKNTQQEADFYDNHPSL